MFRNLQIPFAIHEYIPSDSLIHRRITLNPKCNLQLRPGYQ